MSPAKSERPLPRLLSLGVGLILLAGCKPGADGAPVSGSVPATVKDLGIMLVAEVPAKGGLPGKMKVVFENVSSKPVLFTAPRPLCPKVESDQPPYPLLGIKFAECRDVFWPAYADVKTRKVPEPITVLLAPGRRWSREYCLEDFHFWGAWGPDPAGSFDQYFRPGDRKLSMSVVLVFGEGAEEESGLPRGESPPIAVHCLFPDWMLGTDEPSQK